jgi:hypothetical protein
VTVKEPNSRRLRCVCGYAADAPSLLCHRTLAGCEIG